MRNHADKGARKGPKKYWPAFRYGPVEGDERIFQKPEDVPAGFFSTRAEALAFAEEPPPPAKPAVARPLTPARGRGKPKEQTQREKDVASLLAAGYDPKELETASDAELQTAVKGLPNGADKP